MQRRSRRCLFRRNHRICRCDDALDLATSAKACHETHRLARSSIAAVTASASHHPVRRRRTGANQPCLQYVCGQSERSGFLLPGHLPPNVSTAWHFRCCTGWAQQWVRYGYLQIQNCWSLSRSPCWVCKASPVQSPRRKAYRSFLPNPQRRTARIRELLCFSLKM